MALTSVISNSNKVPGIYLQVSLGVGTRSAGDSPRYVELFGNKTSSGSATVEQEVDVFSLDEARSLFGAGSELFMMAKAAFAANPRASLKAVPVTESAGTQASQTITMVNSAGSSGTIQVWILGELVEVPVANGAAIATMATDVAAYINDQTDWPVTASANLGVVTVTAKNKGPRGNDISIRAKNNGISTTTVTVGGSGYLASGATTDDPQTALDLVTAFRRSLLVAPYSDATQLAKFKTHVNTEDNAEIGHRKQFVYGSKDTYANTLTIATGLNAERGQCCWLEKSDKTPAMIAAAVAAKRAKHELNDPAYNFDWTEIEGLLPHYAASDVPTATELEAALNNGMTPLQSVNGAVYIVRSVTTKSQDSATNPDYRVLDTSKVTVPDAFADAIEVSIADTFKGFKASNDPEEGESPPVGVLTPKLLEDHIYGKLKDFEASGWIVDVDENLDGLVVELSSVAAGRFNFSVPLDVIEGFHQGAGDIRQIG